jgi:hypothetical protein
VFVRSREAKKKKTVTVANKDAGDRATDRQLRRKTFSTLDLLRLDRRRRRQQQQQQQQQQRQPSRSFSSL